MTSPLCPLRLVTSAPVAELYNLTAEAAATKIYLPSAVSRAVPRPHAPPPYTMADNDRKVAGFQPVAEHQLTIAA